MKGMKQGAPGRALTTEYNATTNESSARTAPPIGGCGERLTRFYERLDGAECSRCECRSWDVWMTEGATDDAAKCVACGLVVDELEELRDRVDGGDSR